MLEWISHQITNNQFLAGGAVMGVIAGVVTYGRRLCLMAMAHSRFLFVCECRLESDYDWEPVSWIKAWLAAHEKNGTARRMLVSSQGNRPVFTPSEGRHFYPWRNKRLVIDRAVTRPTGNAVRIETWNVLMRGSTRQMREFLTDCRDAHLSQMNLYIAVFVPRCGSWSMKTIRKRKLQTVIMAETDKQRIVAECRSFSNSAEWYAERGIPWRIGFMFEGPPGNGKTSLITALASEFEAPVYLMNIGSCASINEFVSLVMEVPSGAILVIEDVDREGTVLRGKELVPLSTMPGQPTAVQEISKDTPVDMTTLLNSLDGMLASEGRILILTANHPEKIDPAVIRPGRVDHRIKFEPTSEWYAQMWRMFFPDETQAANDFARMLSQSNVSMASLRNLLMEHGKDAWRHLDELEGYQKFVAKPAKQSA
jgi:chaperone BCS1